MSLIGSTSFGFAQNTIHNFQNTVLNSGIVFDKRHKNYALFHKQLICSTNGVKHHYFLVTDFMLDGMSKPEVAEYIKNMADYRIDLDKKPDDAEPAASFRKLNVD